MASVYRVRCKDKFLQGGEDPNLMTRLEDLVGYGSCEESSREGAESIPDPAAFLRSRGAQFSVYSADFTRRVLGLVRVRSDVNIARAPFFFRAQRENAEELLLIPFALLPAVTDALSTDVAETRNIFLHNTGRCGSTLMCKAIEATQEVQAVSEPDVCTSVLEYRQARGFRLTQAEEKDVLMVLRCSTVLLNFYLLKNDPSRPVICYKFRGFAIFVADLLQKAVPAAKTVFLYRDLPGYFDSWISVQFSGSYWKYLLKTALKIDVFVTIPALVRMEPTLKLITESQNLATYQAPRGLPFFLVSSWLLRMQTAHDLIRDDPDNFFHACLRYNELTAHKEQIILKVLKKLGLNISPEETVKMREVFERNSQEGTFLQSVRKKGASGGSWIGIWEKSLFSSVIEHFKGDVNGPDFLLENTIMG